MVTVFNFFSLSGAELERMFEDDSTGNFEKLELRLKTPKRPTLQKSLVKLIQASTTMNYNQSESTDKKGNVEQIKSPSKDQNVGLIPVQDDPPSVPEPVASNPESCFTEQNDLVQTLSPVQETTTYAEEENINEEDLEVESQHNEHW